MPKRKTHEEFVNELKKTHPNLKVLSKYNGDKKYVTVFCTVHNYQFETKPNWLHQGSNCPKCYNERRGENTRKPLPKLLEELNSVHNRKYTYPNIETEYKNNKSKITIICPIHGEFRQTVNHHLGGQGCNKCADILNGLKKRLTKEEIISKANTVHNGKYDYSLLEYNGIDNEVDIICPIHDNRPRKPTT